MINLTGEKKQNK